MLNTKMLKLKISRSVKIFLFIWILFYPSFCLHSRYFHRFIQILFFTGSKNPTRNGTYWIPLLNQRCCVGGDSTKRCSECVGDADSDFGEWTCWERKLVSSSTSIRFVGNQTMKTIESNLFIFTTKMNHRRLYTHAPPRKKTPTNKNNILYLGYIMGFLVFVIYIWSFLWREICNHYLHIYPNTRCPVFYVFDVSLMWWHLIYFML